MPPSPSSSDRVWLESLFDSSTDPIGFYGRDGRFLKVNRAFEKLVGYKNSELAGKNFIDITPREYHALCRDVLERLVATGRPDIFEKECRRKGGGRVGVRATGFAMKDAAGRLLGYATIARDVTELRRAISSTEAALRGSLSLAEAALESTADGLLVVARDGRVSGFNRRFLEMWRIPRRLADTGKDAVMLDFVLRQLENPDAFIARVKHLYSHLEEESFDTIEFKDGKIFERYSRPQRIGKRVVGRVWSFRDVTAARRLERALADLSGREQARIGRELHDSVGQTFTAIALLAKSAGRDSDAAQKTLRRIEALSRDGVKQTRQIARALLPNELQHGDLKGALHHLESSVRELFAMKCDLIVDSPLPRVEPVLATELYRIAQEAAYNAAKHSRGTRVRVLLTTEHGRLCLKVSDDGSGLPARRSGRGLGLDIMRQRAAHLGATLEVEGGPSGTTVRCELPLASPS